MDWFKKVWESPHWAPVVVILLLGNLAWGGFQEKADNFESVSEEIKDSNDEVLLKLERLSGNIDRFDGELNSLRSSMENRFKLNQQVLGTIGNDIDQLKSDTKVLGIRATNLEVFKRSTEMIASQHNNP